MKRKPLGHLIGAGLTAIASYLLLRFGLTKLEKHEQEKNNR